MTQDTQIVLHSLGVVRDVLSGQRGTEMEQQFRDEASSLLK